MIENFTISFKNSYNFTYLSKILVAIIISALITIPILGYSSISAIVSFLILFMIIYILITSMTNENLSNELPSTLYPNMPHMGLDGISMNSYVAGTNMKSYGV